MKVLESKVEGWDDKLPAFKKAKYPQPLDDNLPRHYNVSIFCGARGSGKSTLAVKYLHELEKRGIEQGVEPRIILISPTAKSDSNRMFDILKSLDENDIIEDYNDDILKEKMKELRSDLEEGKNFQEYKKTYNKFENAKSLKSITKEEYMILEKYDFVPPSDIPQPKYPNGFMTFLIVDDMACSNIFKNGKSYFSNIVIKNRHNSQINIPMNILICVQQIFNVPKTVRLNANLICLFKYGNIKVILEDLYVLVSAWVSPEVFQMLYEKATEDPHSCLIIDITRGKPIFKKGWDTNLELI